MLDEVTLFEPRALDAQTVTTLRRLMTDSDHRFKSFCQAATCPAPEPAKPALSPLWNPYSSRSFEVVPQQPLCSLCNQGSTDDSVPNDLVLYQLPPWADSGLLLSSARASLCQTQCSPYHKPLPITKEDVDSSICRRKYGTVFERFEWTLALDQRIK